MANWNDFPDSDKKLAQAYVLGETTEGNPGLTHSAISSRDKDLHTNKKILTQAVNEVLVVAESAATTVSKFSERFNNVLGNEAEDQESYTELLEIADNMTKAVVSTYKKALLLEEAVESITEKLDNIDSGPTYYIGNQTTEEYELEYNFDELSDALVVQSLTENPILECNISFINLSDGTAHKVEIFERTYKLYTFNLLPEEFQKYKIDVTSFTSIKIQGNIKLIVSFKVQKNIEIDPGEI